MKYDIQLSLSPQDAANEAVIKQTIQGKLALPKELPIQFILRKKSLDARRKNIQVMLHMEVYVNEQLPKSSILFHEQLVSQAEEVHIIGAGPAGYFCALQCIELGLKPVVFERGKAVRERRRDLAILNKEGILNEESNYCFGEGGAGTYSDGKLYTRSNKRGNTQRVLDLFHFFGADENVLYETHPHIGTNKLPQIIEAMRQKIIACGGEIHFESKLTGMHYVSDKIAYITINTNEKVHIKNLVLATGHSAKDIFELLYQKQILIEAKPFALGVRIEHPQALIDSIQYHCKDRGVFLPPASYNVVEQVNNRGVFSFCMCPGGIIAPASTQKNTLVVNGWSPSRRNNPYANSGMVVSVQEQDYADNTPLGALHFQSLIEAKAFNVGGGNYRAPAQRMTDFVQHKPSQSLPSCSYIPGVRACNLQDVLPPIYFDALADAFLRFGKKMKGYFTEEAIVVATESRTSSPVRIPRDKDTLQHVQITNLYPCAEGAGYAGGIMSAAIDGINVANAIKGKLE